MRVHVRTISICVTHVKGRCAMKIPQLHRAGLFTSFPWSVDRVRDSQDTSTCRLLVSHLLKCISAKIDGLQNILLLKDITKFHVSFYSHTRMKSFLYERFFFMSNQLALGIVEENGEPLAKFRLPFKPSLPRLSCRMTYGSQEYKNVM